MNLYHLTDLGLIPRLCSIGGYEADQGVSDTTFGWKSLGEELRPNDVTTDLTSFQHGLRALSSKEMRKSQGKLLFTVPLFQTQLDINY